MVLLVGRERALLRALSPPPPAVVVVVAPLLQWPSFAFFSSSFAFRRGSVSLPCGMSAVFRFSFGSQFFSPLSSTSFFFFIFYLFFFVEEGLLQPARHHAHLFLFMSAMAVLRVSPLCFVSVSRGVCDRSEGEEAHRVASGASSPSAGQCAFVLAWRRQRRTE